MRRQYRVRIYRSPWHLVVTIAFIVVPFLFLWIFSRVGQIATGRLFFDVFSSVFRLAVAYLIAAALAWIAAVAFHRGRAATVALPFFDVLQSFPTFAALPLATYFWGATDGTVIFFLVITIIWPIFFSVLSSLKLMKHEWSSVADVYRLRGWNYVRRVLFPVTLPGLITGSIVGLGEGWEALVATEIIVQMRDGLGSFFHQYQMNAPITAFGILGFLLLIFSVNKLVWLPLLDWSHRTMEE